MCWSRNRFLRSPSSTDAASRTVTCGPVSLRRQMLVPARDRAPGPPPASSRPSRPFRTASGACQHLKQDRHRTTTRPHVLVRPADPAACSGDMYAAVPMITPICVAAAVRLSVGDSRWHSPSGASVSRAFANPKSSTFTVPSSLDLDIGGLQIAVDDTGSCAASRASAICLAMGNASSTGIGPWAIRSARVGPSISSSTKRLRPSASSRP